MKKNKIDNKDYPWYKYYKDVPKHCSYPDCSMYEMVRRCAMKYPSNIAYSYYGTKVTYRTYIKKIDEVACAFIRFGVKKGDMVTLAMPNTPESITCVYALNKLGATVNIMHPLSSEEEFKYGINLTKSKYVICADIVYSKIYAIKDSANIKKILYIPVCESMDPIMTIGYKLTTGRKAMSPRGEDTIPYFRFIARAKFHKEKVLDSSKGSDVAVILHSGGTTGKPKGIELTNNNFNAMITNLVALNKVIAPGKSMLAIMPIFHGFGLGCTFHACMTTGAEAIILPTVNPREFDKTIIKYKPNIIACVPSILESLPSSKILKDADLSFIECMCVGGDSLSESLNKKLDEFLYDHGCDVKVRTAYGMTECTAGVTMMPYEESRLGSVGIPAPDNYIKIVKPGTTEEVVLGLDGEVVINSPLVMKGYINDKKETDIMLKKHKDGKIWLHSGDMGHLDEDGFLYFKSRIKRMIVSSGYNVYPSQIEQIINEHPYVKTSVAVGVPHPYKKEVIKVYIVLKDGLILNSEIKNSIKAYCKKNIASYALPYAYGYRKELPKTKVGKVAYRELINDNEEDDV